MMAKFLYFTLLICNCTQARDGYWTSDIGQGIFESRLKNSDGYSCTIDCGAELSPIGQNARAFLEKNDIYYEPSTKNILAIKFNSIVYLIPFGNRSNGNDQKWRNILEGIISSASFSVYVNKKLLTSFSYKKESANKNVLNAEKCLQRKV